MATIQLMNETVQPQIKTLFNKFYEDKYEEDVRESIFNDLWYLIYQNLISEIIFCLYDSLQEKITEGILLTIDTTQSSSYFISKELGIDSPKISSTTEKYLFVKLNEKQVPDLDVFYEKLNEMINKWNFFNLPGIKTKKETKPLLNVDNLKINMIEIINE